MQFLPLVCCFALWLGCGAATEPGVPDGGVCFGEAPRCRLTIGSCCDETEYPALCVGGVWECGSCGAVDYMCGRGSMPLDECTRWTTDAAASGYPVDAFCDHE